MTRINWRAKFTALKKANSDALDLYANSYENHFRKAFRDGGFTDKSLDPWQQRKAKEKGLVRAILVKSGNLRNSITTKRYNDKRGVGSYGIPYASRHNRGLSGMPQRQFVGKSEMVMMQVKPKIGRIIRNGLSS